MTHVQSNSLQRTSHRYCCTYLAQAPYPLSQVRECLGILEFGSKGRVKLMKFITVAWLCKKNRLNRRKPENIRLLR